MTCSWPVDRECLPPVTGEAATAAREGAEDLAVQVLFNLSGRQFGVCPTIIRPCPTSCTSSIVGMPWITAYLDNGQWRNSPCSCAGSCTRAGPSVIHLPGPVQSVTAITIGGTVQDPDTYSLEGDYLYRAGAAVWPPQNLQRPLDEPGTWSIEYLRGTPVPAGVGVLVGKLTLEFFNACTGGKCRLPRNVETLTRNGVSYRMVNPAQIYADGKTGLEEVDSWLAAVNPHQVMRRPKVR